MKKKTVEQKFHLRELEIKLICKERIQHVADDVRKYKSLYDEN